MTAKPTKTQTTRGSRKVTKLTYKAAPKRTSVKRGRLEIKTFRRGNVTTVEYVSPAEKKKKNLAPKENFKKYGGLERMKPPIKINFSNKATCKNRKGEIFVVGERVRAKHVYCYEPCEYNAVIVDIYPKENRVKLGKYTFCKHYDMSEKMILVKKVMNYYNEISFLDANCIHKLN